MREHEWKFQEYLNELVPMPRSLGCFPFSTLLQEGDPDTYEGEFEAWLLERYGQEEPESTL